MNFILVNWNLCLAVVAKSVATYVCFVKKMWFSTDFCCFWVQKTHFLHKNMFPWDNSTLEGKFHLYLGENWDIYLKLWKICAYSPVWRDLANFWIWAKFLKCSCIWVVQFYDQPWSIGSHHQNMAGELSWIMGHILVLWPKLWLHMCILWKKMWFLTDFCRFWVQKPRFLHKNMFPWDDSNLEWKLHLYLVKIRIYASNCEKYVPTALSEGT